MLRTRGIDTAPKTQRVFRALAAACLSVLLAVTLVPPVGLSYAAAVSVGGAEETAVGDTFAVSCKDASGKGAGTITYVVTKDAVAQDVSVSKNRVGTDQLGEVKIVSGADFTGKEITFDLVSQDKDGKRFWYGVTAVGNAAFKGNDRLESVVFKRDLTGDETDETARGVGTSAFENCTALKSVTLPRVTCAIGDRAFCGCVSLSTFVSPENAEIRNARSGKATANIGARAFMNCTSLETLEIPALTGLKSWVGTGGDRLVSGYQHDQSAGRFSFAKPSGLRYSDNYEGVFSGCSNLKTLVYKSGGGEGGCYYYYDNAGGSSAFSGCESLVNVIYEDEKAYREDGETSYLRGESVDLYEDDETETTIADQIQRFYAVDYYLSKEDAEADDEFGGGRIGRAEYKQGASVTAIAAGNEESLADALLDTRVYDYRSKGYRDGQVLDPNEAARGLSDFDSSAHYVWKLDGSQSRREDLDNSCRAYLVRENDLCAGRVDSSTTSMMYTYAQRNMCRGGVSYTLSAGQKSIDGESDDGALVVDSLFDRTRFHGIDTSVSILTSFYYDTDGCFIIDDDSTASFFDQFKVLDATGNELVRGVDYEVSFRRYDDGRLQKGETLGQAIAGLSAGEADAVLMTVSPVQGSAYCGSFSEWMPVVRKAGEVKECFTATCAETADVARKYKQVGSIGGVDFSDAPFSVLINVDEPESALLAASYAGLVGGQIKTYASSEMSEGFSLVSTQGTERRYQRGGNSFSWLAVMSYKQFTFGLNGATSGKDALGAREYAWGDTAVVVDPRYVEEIAGAVASYAYAKAAPVFYLEDDGALGKDTLECLREGGFTHVVAMGDAKAFPDEVLRSLTSGLAGSAQVERIESGAQGASEMSGTCSLSLEVAQRMLSEKASDGSALATFSVVAVCDSDEPVDAIGALNCSGREGGITLMAASGTDAKEVCDWLYERRGSVDYVCLFGRSNSTSLVKGCNAAASLRGLWGNYVSPRVVAINLGEDNSGNGNVPTAANRGGNGSGAFGTKPSGGNTAGDGGASAANGAQGATSPEGTRKAHTAASLSDNGSHTSANELDNSGSRQQFSALTLDDADEATQALADTSGTSGTPRAKSTPSATASSAVGDESDPLFESNRRDDARGFLTQSETDTTSTTVNVLLALGVAAFAAALFYVFRRRDKYDYIELDFDEEDEPTGGRWDA